MTCFLTTIIVSMPRPSNLRRRPVPSNLPSEELVDQWEIISIRSVFYIPPDDQFQIGSSSTVFMRLNNGIWLPGLVDMQSFSTDRDTGGGYCYNMGISEDGNILITQAQDMDNTPSEVDGDSNDFLGWFSMDGGETWARLPRPINIQYLVNTIQAIEDFDLLGDVAVDNQNRIWTGDQIELPGDIFTDILMTDDEGQTYFLPPDDVNQFGHHTLKMNPSGNRFIKVSDLNGPGYTMRLYDLNGLLINQIIIPIENTLDIHRFEDGQWLNDNEFLYFGDDFPSVKIWKIIPSTGEFEVLYESEDAGFHNSLFPEFQRAGYTPMIVDVWKNKVFCLKAGETSIFIPGFPPAPPTVVLRSVDYGNNWDEIPTPFVGVSSGGSFSPRNLVYHPNEDALYIGTRGGSSLGTFGIMRNATEANSQNWEDLWESIPESEEHDNETIFLNGDQDRRTLRRRRISGIPLLKNVNRPPST